MTGAFSNKKSHKKRVLKSRKTFKIKYGFFFLTGEPQQGDFKPSPCMTIVCFLDILMLFANLFIHIETAEILDEDFVKSSKGERLLKGLGIIGISVCINSILMLNVHESNVFFLANLLNGVILSNIVPLVYIYQNPKMAKCIINDVFKPLRCIFKRNIVIHPLIE